MTGPASELASAAVLSDSAIEMLLDAAGLLKDAGDMQGHAELYGLADQVSKAVEKIRDRKAEIQASKPRRTKNDPVG